MTPRHTPKGEGPSDAEKWLGELLAIIHRDGGQYQSVYGTAKAVVDAHKIWGDLISRSQTGREGVIEEQIIRDVCELPGDDGIPDDRRLVMSINDLRVIIARALKSPSPIQEDEKK